MIRGRTAVAGTIGALALAAGTFGAAQAGTLSHPSGWKLVNLGTAPGYRTADVQPWGLNDKGEVVGSLSETVNGKFVTRAFWWVNGKLALLEGGGNATAVNNSGTVIGDQIDAGGASVGLVWIGGSQSMSLGTLGGSYSTPLVINDHDQVGGFSQTANGDKHAFLWSAGTMTDLGTLGGTESSVTAINDRGQVIGTSTTSSGATHGFLWQGGHITDLGSLRGADSNPTAINNQGEIVGTITTRLGNPLVAFKWRDGKLTNLGRFGAPAAQARDINNKGVILIQTTDAAGNPRAALLISQGKTINLGTLGGLTTVAYHVNDANQAIGLSFTRNPVARHRARRSFVWQHGKMTALPTYDGASPPWGGDSAINEVGQVIGTSYLPHGLAGVIWKPIKP